MQRGRKPLLGVSAAFFREPTLIALRQLSGSKPDSYITYSALESHILKQLGIDIMWKGRQPTTNRPMVRVWVGAVLSKLRADKLIESQGPQAALTADGIKEADGILGRIIAQPQTKPSIPGVTTVSVGGVVLGTTAGVTGAPAPAAAGSPIQLTADELARAKEKEEEKERKKVERAALLERTNRVSEGKAADFVGITVDVNLAIPLDACLPMPDNYRVPTQGAAAKQVKETAIALKNRRSSYIWGLPGSGKDAFIHAYSAMTHTPAQIFTVSPNEDVQSWFFIRSFEKDGTSWEEGEFLKAVRDGYKAPDGTIHPYMILVSDLDRATKNQAEALRLIMDTIQGRVMGPKGIKYPVLPGTQIVATANSSGSGDSRGRCVSSNVLDASILDRFERKFKFDTLDWADEEFVLKNKFPVFNQRIPSAWACIGDSVKALRKNVEEEAIFAEFGHRAVCSWVGHVQDILVAEFEFVKTFDGKAIGSLLRRGVAVLLDSLPDDQTRLAVQRLIDPYIAGGVVAKS